MVTVGGQPGQARLVEGSMARRSIIRSVVPQAVCEPGASGIRSEGRGVHAVICSPFDTRWRMRVRDE